MNPIPSNVLPFDENSNSNCNSSLIRSKATTSPQQFKKYPLGANKKSQLNIPSNLESRNSMAKTKASNTSNELAFASYQLPQQQSISSSGTDGSKSDLAHYGSPKSKEASLPKPPHLTSIGQNLELNTGCQLSPSSHQITSMNESKAKQICKKRPIDVIWYLIYFFITFKCVYRWNDEMRHSTNILDFV